jgi:hypothetical protein
VIFVKPTFFDGTIIAQKHYQPLVDYRIRTLPVIVTLRGSKTLIFSKRISKFKTYGIGQDVSW